MKVLLVGGTGFLGHHIADQLRKAGHGVMLVVRNSQHAQHSFYDSCRKITGDLNNVEQWLPRALSEADAVIYCAGATFRLGQPAPDFEKVNVEFTRRFFEIAGLDPKRVVYVSSSSTLGGTKMPHLAHDDSTPDPALPRNVYDLTKIASEKLAKDSARKKNIDLVTVKPCFMLGPRLDDRGDFSSSGFLLDFLNGKFPFFVKGGHSFCDVRDVARGVVSALERGRGGRQYILGGHNMTLAKFFDHFAFIVNKRAPALVPTWMPRGLSQLLQGISVLTFGLFKNPIPPDLARGMGYYYFTSSQRAVDELSYEISPIEKTLRDFANFCDETGLTENHLQMRAASFPTAPGAERLLDYLIRRHRYAEFLKKHGGSIRLIFSTNEALKNHLHQIHLVSSYRRREGDFKIPADAKGSLFLVSQFFEYLYFSSNDFFHSIPFRTADASNG
jgi:dihydroflavonol-4-reductase